MLFDHATSTPPATEDCEIDNSGSGDADDEEKSKEPPPETEAPEEQSDEDAMGEWSLAMLRDLFSSDVLHTMGELPIPARGKHARVKCHVIESPQGPGHVARHACGTACVKAVSRCGSEGIQLDREIDDGGA